MLIRGFYYEGWDPTGKPVKALLASRVTEGGIEDVLRVLPSEIRDLWPGEAMSLPHG